MKVVVLYQYYQSDSAPGHSLIYDWTQYLAQCGHSITVLAGETGYMKSNKPTLPWYRRIIRKEQMGLVNIVRTFTYAEHHRSYFGRLLSFLSFSLSCPFGFFFINRPDMVIASSPPIFPVFSTWLTCKVLRIPFVVEVRDLWPESAVQMGILKNKPLIKIMAWMERMLYKHSQKIIALTEGIKQDICERGFPKEKVVLVSCGVDVSKLYPDNQGSLTIRKRYQLEAKRIVLYFGALGEANNISVILRAAALLREHNDIIFMLVGDGIQSKEIQQQIKNMELTNIMLHKPVPKDQARLYINAADICMVTLLDIPLFSGALPTKLLDYMACGKPVLCGVRGEAKRIIDGSQAGLTFEPNDEKQLSALILQLLQDKNNALNMGINGFEFINNNYTASKMYGLIEKIMLDSC